MPSEADVQRALELLSQSANYQYFFDKLNSPDWISPLADRGFFRNPPPPIREGTTIRFPFWVESRYLARMAAEDPDLVMTVIRTIPETDNTRVHEDIIDAACRMPARLAATLTDRIEQFIDDLHQYLLPEKVTQLIVHLVDGDELAAAVRLARALLKPHHPESEEIDGHILPVDPRPRFGHPEYSDALDRVMSAVGAASPEAAYRLATDLLEDVLSGSDPTVDRSADFSYIWRLTIQDPSSGRRHRDMRDDLITAVREAANDERIDVRVVVDDLEARHWPVFRRLALHALTTRAPSVPDLVLGRARQVDRLGDPAQRYEYTRLLREALSLTDAEGRQELLDLVLAAEDHGNTASADDKVRQDYRLARTLAALGEALPARGRERLDQLVGELHVTQEDLEASGRPGGVVSSFVGSTSPRSATDLAQMPDAQLLEFLSSWAPSGEWAAPSPEGLGRALQEAVKQDPSRFADLAEEFLNVEPTYVRSLLRGLQDAVKEGRGFDWSSVLRLSAWVLAQADPPHDGRDRDRDPDWSWTRGTIADLLDAGLPGTQHPIPFDLREAVWAQLAQLLEDPDPTPEHEEQYGGSNMDPVTLAINTVRGRAMHAMVQYALWVRRHLGDTAAFDAMPEVKAALDQHLDVELDPSLAVRSVYGQFFPWLHLIDSNWAVSRIETIFPVHPDDAAWFEAAWDAFIVFTPPFDSMAGVLADVLAAAAERLPADDDGRSHHRDPGLHLAEHLAVFVVRGVLPIDHELVRSFFVHGASDLHGHVHEFLGHGFSREDPPIEMLERGMALWEARLEVMQTDPPANAAELESFGAWFEVGGVDPEWRLRQLLDVLRLTGGRIDHTWRVLETLEALADSFPFEALAAVRLLSQPTDETWEILAGRDNIRGILTIGLSHADTRAEAESLAHELGARGYTEFRSILEQR
ncbi:MAG: hypothetical protein ACRD29_05860 [Acidimicrobiales bacterium]